MKPPMSFAPLAGRLAAKAAEIRLVAGAEISWANFMALFWCAIFEMLILLCEALDARAAAEAARLLAGPASRDMAVAAIPVPRAGCQAPSGERHAHRPAPEVQAIVPKPDKAPSRVIERPAPRLAWSRDPGPIRAVHAPPWQSRPETRAFTPVIRHDHIVTIS